MLSIVVPTYSSIWKLYKRYGFTLKFHILYFKPLVTDSIDTDTGDRHNRVSSIGLVGRDIFCLYQKIK